MVRDKRTCEDGGRGQSDVAPGAEEFGWPLETGKDEEVDSP